MQRLLFLCVAVAFGTACSLDRLVGFDPVDSCANGEMNGDETDTDCGGACAPCGLGQACKQHADCSDGTHCEDNQCQEGPPPAEPCGGCPAGQSCYMEVCRDTCESSTDCGAGEACALASGQRLCLELSCQLSAFAGGDAAATGSGDFRVSGGAVGQALASGVAAGGDFASEPGFWSATR